MPADYYVTNSDMKKVADAIRAKTNTTEPMAFPNDFATNIENISSGPAPVYDTALEDAYLTGNMRELKSDVLSLRDNCFNIFYSSFEFNNLMFIGNRSFACSGYTTLILPKLKLTSAVADGNSPIVFYPSLKKLWIPEYTGNDLDYSSSSLEELCIGRINRLINSKYPSTLKKLIINDVDTFFLTRHPDNILANRPGCVMYVPDWIVDDLKAKPEFVDTADRIFPVSSLGDTI